MGLYVAHVSRVIIRNIFRLGSIQGTIEKISLVRLLNPRINKTVLFFQLLKTSAGYISFLLAKRG